LNTAFESLIFMRAENNNESRQASLFLLLVLLGLGAAGRATADSAAINIDGTQHEMDGCADHQVVSINAKSNVEIRLEEVGEEAGQGKVPDRRRQQARGAIEKVPNEDGAKTNHHRSGS
jgi:hypothetical protein